MTLDIWTALALFIMIGIAAMGFVETSKRAVRAFQAHETPELKAKAKEGALYSTMALALCLGLTLLAGRPVGLPWELSLIVGGGANAVAAMVYRWALKSFVPRVLAGITKTARARVDAASE